MGAALVRGLVRGRVVPPGRILCSDAQAAKARGLARSLKIRPVRSNAELARNARVILLAVKPQHVRAAARMADWERKRKGRALGIAMSDTWRSFIATVAEVSVDARKGTIRVHHLWAAVDPGIAIQPDIVVAQIEGASVFGLSHALGERITVKGGAVQQSNFHDYPLLRMADAPEIDVDVLSSTVAPGGIGEVGLPPIAPAVANAVAALTGARVRLLPMLPERVLAALRDVPKA